MKAFVLMLSVFAVFVGFQVVGGWLIDQVSTYFAGFFLLGVLFVVVVVAVRKALK